MSRGQRTDLFISLKQRMLFEEAIQKRAIDYLNTKRDDDYEPLNNKVMKMRYNSWLEVFSEDLKQIEEHITLNSQDVSKSDEVQKDITKRQSIYNFIENNSFVPDSFNPNDFFRKYTTVAATCAINKSLHNMKNASKLPIDLPSNYNDIAKEALKNIQSCYSWSDTEAAYFVKFLIQCKNRLYNIRNNYNIMLALYGDQGSGKTEEVHGGQTRGRTGYRQPVAGRDQGLCGERRVPPPSVAALLRRAVSRGQLPPLRQLSASA